MTVSLVVRRTIRASAARLFQAWTAPELLVQWWGPKGVRCSHAEIDPRVGGRIRIANELPDGGTLWIVGEILELVPDARLVYTWRTDPPRIGAGDDERVTVRFEARGDDETEVIVIHERVADEETRSGHAAGWEGCLDGLASWSVKDARATVRPGA